MDKAEVRSYRIVSAHQPYPVLKTLCGAGTYFTVLRDPVQRAFSLHAHMVRYDWNPNHSLMKDKDIGFFLDWMRDDPIRHLLNHQCYFLSMNLDPVAASNVLNELTAFDVDNVDEQIGPFLTENGGRRLDLHRLNVSSQPYEITSPIRAKIESVFEADAALWTAFREAAAR